MRSTSFIECIRDVHHRLQKNPLCVFLGDQDRPYACKVGSLRMKQLFLQDYGMHVVGVYDKSISFEDLVEDILWELDYVRSFDETPSSVYLVET